MNPNSDLKNKKNNESVMAANAESRISVYAARFAAYSDERLKQTVDHERKVRGWAASAVTSSPPYEVSARNEDTDIYLIT